MLVFNSPFLKKHRVVILGMVSGVALYDNIPITTILLAELRNSFPLPASVALKHV